jgi:undecaprenyl-diphosphatase
LFEAIIIGLVEGLTEFLPISSTGHLLIVQSFLNCPQNEAFNVLIQIGPIAACALVFWKDITSFFTKWKEPKTRDYVLKLFAAFLLTGVGGFIAKKCGLELTENILRVALAVLIGAFVIFAVEYKSKKRTLNSNLTWAVVAAVALGQIIAAIFPGASRSGMAIMGALIVGFARPAAVKFSFLVGIPTMFAAGSYELFQEIRTGDTSGLFSAESIVAYIVATISAWLSVVWLLKFVQTRNFIPFAWYRVVLGIALLPMLKIA